MRSIPLAIACSLAFALPSPAVDISGYVLNKKGGPVAGAQVCVKSETGSCATTSSLGAFRLNKPLSLRPGKDEAHGFSLQYRGGRLLVTSPMAAPARLEWLSPQGRTAFAVSETGLAAGTNFLALPAGLPHTGVCILRLSVPGRSLAWKAVLAPAAAAAAGSASARITALSKAAGATLEISKTGYRTRIYEPTGEVETDVVIVLSETADAGLEFSGTISLKVIGIDRDKKSIITESTLGHCDTVDSAKLVHETVRDTQYYAIRDGRMWAWNEGECYGKLMTGTGADPVGKWTLADAIAPLPADLRAGCKVDSAAGGDGSFNTYTGEYTFTENQITADVKGETCPGDFFGFLFGFLFWNDTTIAIEKNTCRQLGFKNGKGETATSDFSKQGDTLHVAFAFKTSACAGDIDFGLTPKDPECPESSALDPFFDCVSASGFANVTPAPGVDLGPTRRVGGVDLGPTQRVGGVDLGPTQRVGGVDLGPTQRVGKVSAAPPISRARRVPSFGTSRGRDAWIPPYPAPARRGEYISREWMANPPAR